MRIKSRLALTLVLVAAAVGLAMASTRSGAAGPAHGQDGRPQERHMGPPPGGPGRGGPGGIEHLLFDIDLTTAQLEQIKTLTAAQRKADAAGHDQLREVGDKMRALVEADTFDEAAVRALAVSEAAITTELRVSSARTEAAVYHVLTAEQKAALSKLRDERPPREPRR